MAALQSYTLRRERGLFADADYDRSMAIRRQNPMRARPEAENRQSPNSAQTTMPIRLATLENVVGGFGDRTVGGGLGLGAAAGPGGFGKRAVGTADGRGASEVSLGLKIGCFILRAISYFHGSRSPESRQGLLLVHEIVIG
jgi:hypothetical protein